MDEMDILMAKRIRQRLAEADHHQLPSLPRDAEDGLPRRLTDVVW